MINERPLVLVVVRFLGDPVGYWVPRWVTNCRLAGWTNAIRGYTGEQVRVNLDQAYLIEDDQSQS
jgi:hypothetical protein